MLNVLSGNVLLMSLPQPTAPSIAPVLSALPASPHVTCNIGIVVFDRFSLPQAAQVAEVFASANRLGAADASRTPYYRTTFLSPAGEHVQSSSRIAVLTQRHAGHTPLHALFVAGGDGARRAAQDRQFIAWLREVSAAARKVTALGNGTMLLHATAERTQRDAAQSALDIVRDDLGEEAARHLAIEASWQVLPKPESLERHAALSVRDKILGSAQWLARNCDKRVSITAAAQAAGMSERSFLRHFRAELGIKPSEHLRRVRVELASMLLAQTDLPVDKIARRCGLTSGECLARLFRQVLAISPSEYRNRLRSTCAAPTSVL
jgi:transcriptional regulator GlxA family with amidase domain